MALPSHLHHPLSTLAHKNDQVTGIFFENKVDYTTWFGANIEYIHGIQVTIDPIGHLMCPAAKTPNIIQPDQAIFHFKLWKSFGLCGSYIAIGGHARQQYAHIDTSSLRSCSAPPLLNIYPPFTIPQNIPVTAITESVRDAEFVREEWEQVKSRFSLRLDTNTVVGDSLYLS